MEQQATPTRVHKCHSYCTLRCGPFTHATSAAQVLGALKGPAPSTPSFSATGLLDLARVVATLQHHNPEVRARGPCWCWVRCTTCGSGDCLRCEAPGGGQPRANGSTALDQTEGG